MRLSHLEIVGFKSFAGKLDLKLSDGITAVVGPNGCGKSNIVDAIRWVLGEQRASALRGDRMEDIIFNGTTTRKPLGMAEVSLTIDNNEQVLPIEYSEVTLTRRYFRSGDSEYFLNKVPCRLKDITDLLLDTGMGTHAYSIIEQGMVDTIVNGSSMDRRHLIEEAAGINKYKTRRRLAKRKLDSTEQDLIRIADILEEVEKQASGLRRQVWKVERYNRLTQDQKDIEVASAYHEYLALRQHAEPIRQKIEGLSKEKELFTTKISTTEARIEGRQLELTGKEQELNERMQDVNARDQQINSLNERVVISRTRRSALEHRMEAAQQESQALRAELEKLKSDQAQAQEEVTGLSERLERARKAFQEREAESQRFSQKVIEGKEQARILQRRRYDLVQRQTEKQGEVHTIEHRLEGLQNQQRQLTQTKERLAAELVEIEKKIKDVRTKYQQLTASLEESQSLKATLDTEIQTRQTRHEELRNRKSELDTELAAREREHGLLLQMRQRYEGFGQGVRALLVDGPAIEGLQGTLAECMKVDKQYAPAVEAYLGDVLQYIVSTTTQSAQSGVRYLQEQEHGKVSFLLLDRLTENNASRRTPHAAFPDTSPGIVGAALDYVHVSEEMKPTLTYLLQHVVLVDNLETALNVADQFNDGQGWQLLTLDGEVVDPAGILSGGVAAGGDTSLLSRTARIETLDQEITEARAEQQSLADEIVTIVNELNALLERRTKTSQVLEDQQRNRQQVESTVKQLEFQQSQLSEQASRANQESGTTDVSVNELRSKHGTLKAELSNLAREREDAEESDREAQESLDQLEADGQKLATNTQEARVALISLESRGNELRTTMDHMSQNVTRITTTIDQRQQEITSAQEQGTELKERLEEGEAKLKELYGERREKEIARDAVATEFRTVQDDIRSMQTDIQETQKGLAHIQEQIHQAELQDAELYQRSNSIRQMLMEQHDMDPENLTEQPTVPGMEAFDPEAAQGMLLDVKRKVDDLGPLNLAAIEEYNAAKERQDFLTQQRDDLIEAKENLEKTIVKMNRAARARFLDTFEEVRQNFMKTFQALFEGGEADLRLEEGDPLEVGIDIMARPRGKRLQSIALLSGGETALTAIALLFAIYLYKPSPFCIFDEVDAPLDDANVRRFASAIQQFAHDTQFLIVTHNKRTMEAANYLYGVTMEEPGMSKMVSVELEGKHEDDLATTASTNRSGQIEEPVSE